MQKKLYNYSPLRLIFVAFMNFMDVSSGVARGVAGVAEATPIFQILFNKFGQKIWVNKS